MPSCRTSFPSLGSTTSLPLYSFLLLRSREKGSAQAWIFAVFFRRSPTYRTLLVEQFGPPRFLGSPLVPLPCSRDPGRATLATVNSARWCCPRHIEHEGHDNDPFEADSHGFSTRCLRFQIRISLHWQDSLPVG